MIKCTDIGGSIIYLNQNLIERIEICPDTIIYMNNSNNYMVRDSVEDVVEKMLVAKRLELDPRNLLNPKQDY
ncbi:MAG: flagellar FlbD family protein [Lentisphaeria bacterium]|nr:flagellar FlbD family protein [Lentisphaeria bacterium]NQZ70173.1 flagellar FlbD family protein [Lentisphaeria bacterium]